VFSSVSNAAILLAFRVIMSNLAFWRRRCVIAA